MRRRFAVAAVGAGLAVVAFIVAAAISAGSAAQAAAVRSSARLAAVLLSVRLVASGCVVPGVAPLLRAQGGMLPCAVPRVMSLSVRTFTAALNRIGVSRVPGGRCGGARRV